MCGDCMMCFNNWVICFRYLVFVFGILIFLTILILFFENAGKINEVNSNTILNYIKILLYIIFPIWIYYRTGHHIKDINKRIKEKIIT